MQNDRIKKYVNNKLGLRYKEEKDGGILIYGNTWTLLVDIFKLKWLKIK